MPAETAAVAHANAARLFLSLFAAPVANAVTERAGCYDSTKQLYVDERGKPVVQSMADSTYCQVTTVSAIFDPPDTEIHYEVCD